MMTLHAQTAVFCCRNINMQVDTMILTSLANVTAMTESPPLQGAVVCLERLSLQIKLI